MPTCPDGHQSSSADFCDTCGMRIEGAPAAAAASTAAGSAAAAGGASSTGEVCPVCGSDRNGLFCEVCGFDFAAGTPATPVDPANLFGAGQPDPGPGPVGTGLPGEPAGLPDPGPGPLGPVGVEPVTSPQTGPSSVGSSTPDPTAAGPGIGSDPGAANGWAAVVSADREYFDGVVAAGGPDAASIEFPAYCPQRRFSLTGQEMRIGRHSTSRGLEPEIDLAGPPADPGISHLHAVLIAQPDGTWSVLDPGSSNGTQVNGNEIVTGVPYPLHSGDKICLGAWTVLTIDAPD
ncbi:MAG TPA: FHA domain-containing protein [Streptosporangiaceae bacterium]